MRILNYALAGLLLAATAADAQTAYPALNIARLDLNPGGRDSLIINGGRLNEAGTTRLTLIGHYLNQPSITRLRGDNASLRLGRKMQGIAQLSHSLTDWLEAYAMLPVVIRQTGGDVVTSRGFAPIADNGIGAASVGVNVAALRQDLGMPVNLALGFGLTIPHFGSEEALVQDRTARLMPSFSVGRALGDVYVGAMVGGRFRSNVGFRRRGVSSARGDTVTHELVTGLTAQYAVSPRFSAGLDVLADFSSVAGGPDGGGTLQPFANIRYKLLPGIEMFAAFGVGFGKLVGTPRYQGLGGLAFVGLPGEGGRPVTKAVEEVKEVAPPVSTDDDGDGIDNLSDACPKQAEDKDGFEDADGCPDEDNDGDGVPDAKDACPDKSGAKENAGCPAKDSDNDGVADVADRCPTEAGPVAEGGCPVRDADKDGVRDERDLCPNEPGDEAHRGCPVKDTDGDGVSDDVDNCIREKGTAQNAGCPPKVRQLVTITREKLVISDKVYFAPGKAVIMPKSRLLLNQVGKILREHPEIPKISVEGHTDNIGNPKRNMKLSEARAKAVARYLVKQGVKAERIEAVGHGQEKPLAENNTAQGRETNRRVDFVIVDAPDKTESTVEPVPLK